MKFAFLFFLTALNAWSESRILRYDVEIQPDIKNKSISGKTAIKIGNPSDSISFDIHDLIVDKVTADGKTLSFKVENKKLTIEQKAKNIEIIYHGQPKRGIIFG